MSPSRTRHLFLFLGYLLSLLMLTLFWVMTENKYEWMLQEDPSMTLPEDPNLPLKLVIFGIPLILAVGLKIVFCFRNFGTAVKIISSVFAVGIVLVSGLRAWQILF